ncbi:MAG: LysR family transcriptional regulator [Proteobacteria bacterium]|nr:MAG: LysR family transcriptional regulator [Pseudomonadota bacterium]
MRSDQLDGLMALKVVAEKKSFTAAATVLGVSPSAVSQAIKQLESRLGIALLSRTTRSTSLTEAGEGFLNQAGPAIDQIVMALETVGTYASKPSGLLRINLPRILYPTYLGPIISSFTKKYPEISVELFFEDAASDMVENSFDAGIRLSEILAQDMVALKLFGPVRFVVAGAPKYFAKHGRPKTPKDLLSHNCILMRLGRDRLYDRWEFESKKGEFQIHVKGSLIFNDSTLMRHAGVNGEGLIYTTEDSLRDLVSSGKMEVVMSQYAATSSGFYLYYPKRSQVMPKLRAFIDHLNEYNRSK